MSKLQELYETREKQKSLGIEYYYKTYNNLKFYLNILLFRENVVTLPRFLAV